MLSTMIIQPLAVLYLIQFKQIECVTNNVCPTIEDYYSIKNNPKCWYDFTVDSNVTEIIDKHGYPVEEHKVITPDGYILTMIRIPNTGKKNEHSKKGPVFVQHGMHCSAESFVAIGKDSLAFLLSDAGYDVWLGNFRGNEYSEGHVNLTTNDYKYWDYSIDELGLYDIPTQIKVIADKTGQKGSIIYIGHSLGTTAALAYSSAYPEEAKEYVKLFVMMAPAATLGNAMSALKLTAPFADLIYDFIQQNDLMKLTSQGHFLRNVLQTVCLESPILMKRCHQMLTLVFGVRTQVVPELIPVQLSQYPAGISIKVPKQAADMFLNFFGRYNYGPDNLAKYGTVMSPKHEISKILVPVYIIYSAGDWLTSKKDSLILYSKLPRSAKIYGIHEVAEKNFNHNDYLYGRNVKSLVYQHILNLIATIK